MSIFLVVLLLIGCFVPEGNFFGVKYEYFFYLPISIFSICLIIRDFFNKRYERSNILIFFTFIFINLFQFTLLNFKSNLLYFAFSTFPLTYIYGNKLGKRISNFNELNLKRYILIINSLITSLLIFTTLNADFITREIDTVELAGKAFNRNRVGSFESNSYAITLIGIISLIFILYLFLKIKFKIKLSEKIFNTGLLSSLFINIIFTFSRTSFISIIISLFFAILSKFRSKYKKIKINKNQLIVILFSSIIIILGYRVFVNKLEFVNFVLDTIFYRLKSIADTERIYLWNLRISDLFLSLETIIYGKGFFISADNTLISLISTLGILIGSHIYFSYIFPFLNFQKKIIINSKRGFLSISSTFLLSILPVSTIIFSLTGDIIGQSKSLPIIFFSLGISENLISLFKLKDV